MKIIAIDPGNEYSGAVLMDGDGRVIIPWTRIQNARLLRSLDVTYHHSVDEVAIEMPKARGMPTANQEFETCVVIGHFEHAFGIEDCRRIYRHQVKQTICGSMTAKDSNISAAIRDLYPQTGGGSKPSVGTKAKPGPLYGVSKDAWQALAVGLTHLVLNHELELDSIRKRFGGDHAMV